MLIRSGEWILIARTEDTLIYALSKFVSIPSVSSCAEHREDCRQAAIWLTKCFAQLGASSKAVRILNFFRHSTLL